MGFLTICILAQPLFSLLTQRPLPTQLFLCLQFTASTTEPKGKATLEEIYTQIFKDLNKAKELLEGYVRPDDKSKFKPDVSVVNGLLVEPVYLLDME